MKKMNKKGFTLIELLAVIVILAIIMVIAVPQILNVINSSRESAWNDNLKMIERSIETNDAVVGVNGGSKIVSSSGCTVANITAAANIDSSAQTIALSGTPSDSQCKFTVTPVSGKSFSGQTAATITCTSTGCSH